MGNMGDMVMGGVRRGVEGDRVTIARGGCTDWGSDFLMCRGLTDVGRM